MSSESIEIKNWKLKEVADYVEIVASDSIQRRDELLNELHIPHTGAGLYELGTKINWLQMPEYYKCFLDISGFGERIRGYFERSALATKEKIIITYGHGEPMVRIPMQLFFDDWKDFIASTAWETILFSKDYSLIMEVSRDYIYSNFKIKYD